MSHESAPWPRIMAAPAEVLRWLDKQRPLDAAGKKCVLTLRWLVHAELDRSVPDPPPSITHFTPEPSP